MSETIRLEVGHGQEAYPVLVGRGLLGELGAHLRGVGLLGQVAVVADEKVLGLWGAQALASLPGASVFRIPAGEAAKTLEWAERLWGELVWAGFGRGDCVVALGGGATGDLAGFVAATYHRGLPLVQVPTTLLAQVDSSVGGKTAIDHPLGKNLIGAFHAPRLVVADLQTWSTLPTRERWSGLAEVVKAALIQDPGLLDEMERELETIATDPDWAGAEALVARAVRIKARVVEGDERDQGKRRILNFGHTLGHALEMLTGFGPLTHGEAVVLGMRGALEVSRRLGRLTDGETARAQALLARFPIPSFSMPQPAELLDVMRRDKKMEGDRSLFVTVGPLGQAWVQDVDEATLVAAIGALGR
jgi:3-dehydroquinate synthase